MPSSNLAVTWADRLMGTYAEGRQNRIIPEEDDI